jgi:hypothetical protein
MIVWYMLLSALVLLSGVLLVAGFLLLRQALRRHARRRPCTRKRNGAHQTTTKSQPWG